MGFAISKAIVRAELEKLKSALANNNLQNLSEQMNEELNLLNCTTLDIAVTGVSGAGKSSLVNALRGLDDFAKGAAQVGVTQTTKKPKGYPHPVFPKLTVWDLPGIETPEFQANEYLKMTDFAKYDFFIVMVAERITEQDILLAKEIQKMKKRYYFVRSKVDQTIKAEKRNPEFCEEKCLKKMRKYYCENLRKAGESKPMVFLLSSWKLSAYDFPLFQVSLLNELDGLKRQVITESMAGFSRQILEKKKAALEALIWKVALVSCAVDAIPVPGLTLACNFPFLVSTMEKFRKVFGLDEESLSRLAQQVGKPIDELKSAIKKSSSEINKDFVRDLMNDFTMSWIRTAVRLVLGFIPGLSFLSGGGLSFVITFYMLKKFLNDVMEDAENVRVLVRE